jgi:hypothetical protein
MKLAKGIISPKNVLLCVAHVDKVILVGVLLVQIAHEGRQDDHILAAEEKYRLLAGYCRQAFAHRVQELSRRRVSLHQELFIL